MEQNPLSVYLTTTNCIVFGTIFTVTAVLWYFTEKFKFWKKRGVSGPTPIPFLGNLLGIILNPISTNDTKNSQKYGRVYGVFEGSAPRLVVADPDLLRQILVKDFNVFSERREFKSWDNIFNKFVSALNGEDWKRVRTILTPTFTSGKMRKMYLLMKECADDLMEAVEKDAGRDGVQGKDVDVKRLFGNYSLDVIAKCCFATKTNAHKDPDSEFVKRVAQFFQMRTINLFIFLLLPLRVINWLRISFVAREARDFFVNVILHLVKQRKESHSGLKHSDFLQLLIDAQQDGTCRPILEEEADESHNESHHGNETDKESIDKNAALFDLKSLKKKSLDEDEVVAQAILFFAAGYETTNTLLSWLFYQLALSPDVQETLYNEISTALEKSTDNNINYEMLTSLPYLDAVVSETLRYYPPALRLERRAVEDYVLGEAGIALPKGTIVQVPVYAIHHDPELYPEPSLFNPDRFLPENRPSLVPYSYLPFGAGPRNCVAMRFALVEAKCVVARVVYKYIAKRVANTQVPPVFNKGGGFLQCKSMVIAFEARK